MKKSKNKLEVGLKKFLTLPPEKMFPLNIGDLREHVVDGEPVMAYGTVSGKKAVLLLLVDEGRKIRRLLSKGIYVSRLKVPVTPAQAEYLQLEAAK